MKRVLIVINTAFVEFGGLTTVVMNYFRFMDKTGLKIDIASTNHAEKKLVREVREAGCEYYCLGERKNIVKYITNLNGLIRKNNYDIIHVHGNSATATFELFNARLCGVPKRIVHIHNSTSSHMCLHKMLMPIFTRSYTDAVACSEKAAAWIFKPGTYQILNNAIDTKRYSYSAETRQKLRKEHSAENKFILCHVGKINEQKNHTFLIKVFAEVVRIIPDALLVLVGDGDLRSNIEKQADAAGIRKNVIFMGMCSNVQDYLSMGDVFVFPSLWEGLPLSLVEAQASGLKCVVSDKITKEANVTDKVKYLSLESSPKEWAEEVVRSREYDRSAECDDNIRLITEEGFNIYHNAEKLRKLYLEK